MSEGDNETIQERPSVGEKSPRYPSIELDFAIKVVAEARKFGTSITDAHIAGKGKPTGGAFRSKKASLGYYGLVSGHGSSVEITELASKILFPKDELEKNSAIKQAFLSPVLFKKLYDATSKGQSIDISVLGNILVRDYGIKPSSKNEFLNTFIKSGIFAGLLKYAGESKTEITLMPVGQEETSLSSQTTSEVTQVEEKISSDYDSVELTLTHGKGKIIVPKELTEIDVKKLRAQINLFGNIFEE